MEAVTRNQLSNLPSLAVKKQRTSHELPAKMITSKKGLATAKTLQNFTVSRHVYVKELRGFEVSLDVANKIYSERNLKSNYHVDRMQTGDELTITLLKPTIDSQETPSLDKGHDFLCEFISGSYMKNIFKININDKDFAIAIPGRIFRNVICWETELLETTSKDKLRQLGLNVISFQKIVIAKIDGVTVPAIVMPLFTEIRGHIADHKKASALNSFIDDIIVKNQTTGDMLPVKEIPDEKSFLAILHYAIQDAGTLVKNKISLSPGSINYQISNSGDVELYLFDLHRVMNVDAPQAILCEFYANKMLKNFYKCMHSWNSLAFDPTTSNSKLEKELSDLINQAAESNSPESASSQKRNHPEEHSAQRSSCKKQKKGTQKYLDRRMRVRDRVNRTPIFSAVSSRVLKAQQSIWQ